MMGSIRKARDVFRQGATYASAFLFFAVLLGIFAYVFINGSSLLSWDLLTSDYHTSTYTYESSSLVSSAYADPAKEDAYFSSRWGIAFADGKDVQGDAVVSLVYINEASPLSKLSSDIQVGEYFTKAFLDDGSTSYVALAKYGAEKVAAIFDEGTSLTSFSITTKGGGIRGALLSTLAVIGLSLLLAMPLGIGAAVYFVYYAPKNRKWVSFLERMIEVTAGIPSIIFGLIGVAVFIPLCNGIFATSGGSLLSGSLTMVIILLPTIVKTSEEAIREVPASYRMHSLALGASERQTLYQVVLPTALPGLLSAVVLSTGRIIGESAALVYAIGTYISDSVSLTGSSATLAVEIWSLLAGENPNYSLASAIAILILIVVFLISLLAKSLSYLLTRKASQVS
jgi:phosphate transport system permease protein